MILHILVNTHQHSSYSLFRPEFTDLHTEREFRTQWVQDAVEWLATPVYYGIGTISVLWIALDFFANQQSWLLSSLLRLLFAGVCFTLGWQSHNPRIAVHYSANLSLVMMFVSTITGVIVALSSPFGIAYSYYPYSLIFQLICWGGITRMSLLRSLCWSAVSLLPMEYVLLVVQHRWSDVQSLQTLLVLHTFWATGVIVGWITTWVFEIYGRRQFITSALLQENQEAIEKQYQQLNDQHTALQQAHEEIETANQQLTEAYRSIELRHELEQKLSQAQLRATEHESEVQRLRVLNEAKLQTEHLMENALDAVVSIDTDSSIIAWNVQAEHTFGWKREEVIGKKLWETLVPIHHREAHRHGVDRVLSTGKPRILNQRVEITALHKDGHELPVELTVIKLMVEGVTVFSAFIRDITERKQAEELTKNYQQSLENDVRERTKQLEEKTQELECEQQELFIANQQLDVEREKSENLLLSIIPKAIARRLQAGESTIAERYEHVSVMFADLVGFTEYASQKDPIEVVDLLNRIFSTFDYFSELHKVEKIKTIGDAYMIVSGIPTPTPDHALELANMALEMLSAMELLKQSLHASIDVRIGIHTGAVVGGIIGTKKLAFDIWGDTVNTASRMESHGLPGKIHCSEPFYLLTKNHYHFEERGSISVKSKGAMTTYFLQAQK